MKNLITFLFISFVSLHCFSQGRNINKLTLETTYSFVEIHKSLRDLIDKADKASYFNDDFFNDLLKKIVTDKQFSDKEKVQLFYLMQKKIGYAFVGVDYLPPKQNYFSFHSSKLVTYQKTKNSLKALNYDPINFIQLAETNLNKDAIVAANALFLAALLNQDSTLKKLEYYSQGEVILKAKNANIFNHYVCLSASLIQSPVIVGNLKHNILSFKSECFIEDAFCALYSKNNPVAPIKEYILQEKNSQNDLAIETALCALAMRVPPATFLQSVKNLILESKEKWKTNLCSDIEENKILNNYSLSTKDQITSKSWENVLPSVYNDGVLISNENILEFDPN